MERRGERTELRKGGVGVFKPREGNKVNTLPEKGKASLFPLGGEHRHLRPHEFKGKREEGKERGDTFFPLVETLFGGERVKEERVESLMGESEKGRTV